MKALCKLGSLTPNRFILKKRESYSKAGHCISWDEYARLLALIFSPAYVNEKNNTGMYAGGRRFGAYITARIE